MLFLNPCFLCFISCWFLAPFWAGKERWVRMSFVHRILVCACVLFCLGFFSSVYVVLNVVFYLRGFFRSCIKHKHQWHVNHVANRAECIPLLCPDRPHPLTIVYKASSVFPFHVSPFCFAFV